MIFMYNISNSWSWLGVPGTTHFGYPFGMDNSGFVGFDLLIAVSHLLGVIMGSAFSGMNVMLMLSFPLTAVAAYVCLRMVNLRGPLAVVLAVSFTFIPFHFGRLLGHFSLGTLFQLVIGLLLVILIGSGRLNYWLEEFRGRALIVRFGGLTAVIILIAFSNFYFIAFTSLLLMAALVWRGSQGDSLPRLLRSSGVVIVFGLFAMLGQSSILLSRLTNPETASGVLRDPMDSVNYAGNLAIGLIPEPYSTIFPRYNQLIQGLFSGAPESEPHLMSNYGTWITLLCTIVMLIGLYLGTRKDRLASQRDLRTRNSRTSEMPYASLGFIAYLLICCLLMFSPWTLNYLLSFLFQNQVRGWNRLIPVILLLVTLGAGACFAQWQWTRKRITLFSMSFGALLIIIVECVIPWRNIYSYVAIEGASTVTDARAFASAVNAFDHRNCGVLNLPIMSYPENGPMPPSMGAYDHFLVGMVNEDKKFSFGAVRDTKQSAWQSEIDSIPTAEQLQDLKFQGFCGVQVDTAGEVEAETVIHALQAVLGPEVVTSPGGRWVYFQIK